MNTILRIIRHPYSAAKACIREHQRVRFIVQSTQTEAREVRKLYNSVRASNFERNLRHKVKEFASSEVGLRGVVSAVNARFLYALVRSSNAATVVETGVCNGMSTAYVLQALYENGNGHLYSIDLPNHPTVGSHRILPEGYRTGELVPSYLRSAWDLIEGDAKECLPLLLSRLGEIDIFIHDSLHTYEHMLWEYQTAWPYIRAGGFLLSDDVEWNDAFSDFLDTVDGKVFCVSTGQGALKKTE